ncbi:MAG: hypothetical protein EZS28_028806 [Streblomastix strix]|uniref:Uncharacterized protein n=1 Tax=Streblomastix strix TaxID=222440 RepID=A0A5J4UZ28_9EUKA|nr:MAG: hypothetical protein EZS28_028806 [Streblomastix strix]
MAPPFSVRLLQLLNVILLNFNVLEFATIEYIAPPSKELLQFVNSTQFVNCSDEQEFDQLTNIPPPLPDALLHPMNFVLFICKSPNCLIIAQIAPPSEELSLLSNQTQLLIQTIEDQKLDNPMISMKMLPPFPDILLQCINSSTIKFALT